MRERSQRLPCDVTLNDICHPERSEAISWLAGTVSAQTPQRILCSAIPVPPSDVGLAVASAQTLTGTVKNSTTGKPAAGDEVILITLGNGMEEAGRTKADAKGNFSFKLAQQGPHLVRVIHQEVTYHRMAPPGTTSVEVEVYDVGKQVEGIEVVADIMRFQAQQGQLQIERTFAVQNNSKPPRTQMNEHNLEFYVPEGASITEAQAMTAGGQPVKSAPVPEGQNAKNKYSFLFPLRPGETRFEVIYTHALHRQHQYRSQERLSAAAFRRHRSQVDHVRARVRNELLSN